MGKLTGCELLKIDKEYSIEEAFKIFCRATPDINDHLETLREYGSGVESITEFGVRAGGSTIAWVAARPRKLRIFDIVVDNRFQTARYENWCQELGIDYEYIIGDTRRIEIDPTELLFIDTKHNYHQLKEELSRHGEKVSKFIIFHDTEKFKLISQNKKSPGLMQAIEEFLAQDKSWRMENHFENCNGLTIIAKVPSHGA